MKVAADKAAADRAKAAAAAEQQAEKDAAKAEDNADLFDGAADSDDLFGEAEGE